MRIRRKKHLKERIEKILDYVIVPPRDIVNVLEAIKDKRYFDYQDMFGNDNPVEMEIGCGKGGFVTEMAKLNPNKNFIAVELLDNIIVMAGELAKKQGLKNVKFVNSGAEYLPRYIMESSIDNIYLNFSPPYPSDAYENRRLTCDPRIESYKAFLKANGSIYQKTDDKDFFEYSFNQFVKHGFVVENVSEKIEKGEMANVQTEYEKKFREQGMPIYALIATKR